MRDRLGVVAATVLLLVCFVRSSDGVGSHDSPPDEDPPQLLELRRMEREAVEAADRIGSELDALQSGLDQRGAEFAAESDRWSDVLRDLLSEAGSSMAAAAVLDLPVPGYDPAAFPEPVLVLLRKQAEAIAVFGHNERHGRRRAAALRLQIIDAEERAELARAVAADYVAAGFSMFQSAPSTSRPDRPAPGPDSVPNAVPTSAGRIC